LIDNILINQGIGYFKDAKKYVHRNTLSL